MTRATKMSDPVRSPKPALRVAEVACLECVRDKDCPDDKECVEASGSGHAISDDEILSNAREVRRALTDKTADALQAAEGGQA